MAESSSAESGTFRAIGPSTGRPTSRAAVLGGHRPGLGRKPTTPQKAAGLRSEPPMSEPAQSGTMPVASATAEPPDEPAQVFAGIEGIAGRAVDRVGRVGAGAELRRVGLADDDAARRADPRHHAASPPGTWSPKIGEP